ncbi:hypothetical protein FGIG_03089 [Fasciola gigantica]|uniref:Integrase catalytic domain-containing protein n=1 Tax=Fasciola gigantica TaxID=46835 RepID=A0A504YLG4_FASGI|nr:hypothetical protein FGIG_03089 [Fasciola gigantica]
MSNEPKRFLHDRVVTMRTTAHNPRSNGQIERSDGTLSFAVKSRSLPCGDWEMLYILSALFHAPLPKTSLMNAFPSVIRKSTSGASLTSWLVVPGPVPLRHISLGSKHKPLVDEMRTSDCPVGRKKLHPPTSWLPAND